MTQTLPVIDYATATDDELDRWLAEHVMFWVYVEYDQMPAGWESVIYPKAIEFWVSQWQPSRNRDQADMALSKFWDRWHITVYRDISGTFYAIATRFKDSSQVSSLRWIDTESRVRAELACAIALYEANQ